MIANADMSEPLRYWPTRANTADSIPFRHYHVRSLTDQSRPVTLTDDDCKLAPTADAGSDQSVAAGVTVTLDGSGSSDDRWHDRLVRLGAGIWPCRHAGGREHGNP